MESSCDLGVGKGFLDKTRLCKSKIIKINLGFIENINSPFKIHYEENEKVRQRMGENIYHAYLAKSSI